MTEKLLTWQDEFAALSPENQSKVSHAAGVFRVPLIAAYYRSKELGVLNENPPSPQTNVSGSQAASDVVSERRRQVEAEGWTPEHDDAHDDFSLALAAATYAVAAAADGPDRSVMDEFGNFKSTPYSIWTMWPKSWDIDWFKPRSRRHDLVRSAALIIAEIERLDRGALSAPATEGE